MEHGITLTSVTARLRAAATAGDLGRTVELARAIDDYCAEAGPMWANFHAAIRSISEAAMQAWITSPPHETLHQACYDLFVSLDAECRRLNELAMMVRAMHAVHDVG